MKSKLNYLIGISLKRKIKTKWFMIANIVLLALIVGLMNIDSVITLFGGDFNNTQKIYIIDNTNETYELFENALDTVATSIYGTESTYELVNYDDTSEKVKELLETDEEQKNLALIFNPSQENVIEFELISKEYLDLVETQLITSALNSTKTALALQKTNISQEELNKIYSSAVITVFHVNNIFGSNDWSRS